MIGRIRPWFLWCVVCVLAAFSALVGAGQPASTLALCLFAATPGLLEGARSLRDSATFSGYLDVALWIIVTSLLIAFSGGEASPLVVMFVLPVLSCLTREEPEAAGIAGLSAIVGYLLASAGVRLGIFGSVAAMQLLVMPLTLGALALISVHVSGIVSIMARRDTNARMSASGMSAMTAVPSLSDDYAHQEIVAQYVRDRNSAIHRVALAEQKQRAHADQIRRNAVRFSRRMQFFAELGLDMKTPLNIMTGFSEEVAKSVVRTRNAQAAEYAAQIFHAGEALRILVDNMEDIARISSGGYRLHREQVDIDDVIAVAYKRLTERARERKVTLVSAARCELVAIADQRALRQMVLNMLGYCLEAAVGEDVRAGLWARTTDKDHIQIGAFVSGHAESSEAIVRKSIPVRMSSSDTPDSGLAVARAFAELHGGRLSSSVRSDGRFGVWVMLPGLAACGDTPIADRTPESLTS